MNDVTKQLKQEKLLRLARKDINVFNEVVLKDAHTGKLLKQADIHLSWQKHIDHAFENNLFAGILAPWAHGKTVQILGRVLYHIGLDPGIRIKLICNADSQASGRVSTVKNYIEYSNEYQTVFPDIKPNHNEWAAQKFSVQRPVHSPDATLTSHGILSSGIGGRADMIIADDIVDQKNAILNPGLQPQVISSYYETWLSRLEPKGKVIYIATRWTMTDLTSELMRSTKYLFLIQRISKDFKYIEEEVING